MHVYEYPCRQCSHYELVSNLSVSEFQNFAVGISNDVRLTVAQGYPKQILLLKVPVQVSDTSMPGAISATERQDLVGNAEFAQRRGRLCVFMWWFYVWLVG